MPFHKARWMNALAWSDSCKQHRRSGQMGHALFASLQYSGGLLLEPFHNQDFSPQVRLQFQS